MMNFPDEETRNAFLAELKALEAKYGFGFRIGGWECEIDFGPNYSSVGDFREAMKPDTYAGWDDIAHYGPPIPRELWGKPVTLAESDSILAAAYAPSFMKMMESSNVLLGAFDSPLRDESHNPTTSP